MTYIRTTNDGEDEKSKNKKIFRTSFQTFKS